MRPNESRTILTYRASALNARPSFVPSGEYRVEVVDAVLSLDREAREIFELKLRTEAGSILFDELVFAAPGFWKIDAFRASIGDTLVPGELVEVCCEDLVGRIGMARLVVVEDEGRIRNKVMRWLPPVPPVPTEWVS